MIVLDVVLAALALGAVGLATSARAQRQPTAILAAHASASSREATSTIENPPMTSLVSG